MRAVGVMIFAYVWRIQDVFPILGKIRLPLLATAVALIFFFLARHPWRRVGQLRSPILGLVLALFAVMLAGVPTSLWRGYSLSFTLKDYLMNVVFMGLVAASVRSVRDVEWYAKVTLYGAIFFATVVSLFFRVGSDGRLGDLIYYDANDFALVMAATIPFAVYFMRAENSTRHRIVGLAAVGILMLGIVKSGSRGGLIGLVVVLSYVLLRYRAIPSRMRLFAAVAGVGLVLMVGTDKYWELMSTILHPQSDYNWSDPQGRRAIWNRGISYMAERPLLGVGVGAFPIAEGTLSEVSRELAARGKGFKWSVAHNSFLETGAELGIPGLALFIALLVTTVYTMARIKPGIRHGPWVTRRESALGQMLVGSFIGFTVCGFFVSAEYFSYLYFLIGLALGLYKVLRLQRAAALAHLTQGSHARAAPVGAVGEPHVLPHGW